jgi:hypothetical protein
LTMTLLVPNWYESGNSTASKGSVIEGVKDNATADWRPGKN